MSGGLDDLSFELKAEMDRALADIKSLSAQLSGVYTSVGKINTAFKDVGAAQVRRLADSVRSIDFTNLTGGANSLYSIANAAESAATVMDTVSTSVLAVEHGITAAAFTATSAATTFTGLGRAAAGVTSAFSSCTSASRSMTATLQTTATASSLAAPALNSAARASSMLSRTLHTVSGGARVASSVISGAGSVLRSVAGVITHVAHSLHAVLIVTDLLKTAFSILMVPVQMVWSVAVAAFTGLGFALRAVLLPVQLLWSGFVLLAKATWAVVKPILGLALAVAKVWFIFKGWIGAVKIIFSWLSMLPPKLRLLVGGMLALGAAGKVGAAGLKALTFTVQVATGAARLAINGFRLLSLPILALVNPAAAARNAMSLLGSTIGLAGRAALAATSKMYGLAASIGRLASTGLKSVASGFMSIGANVAKLGPQIAAFGVLAATAIGTKFAVATEKNSAVFGIMLKDMQQGQAVVKSLQASKAAKLFDNQELLDSGRLLFKSGVSAADLTAKTEQLATIASATSTEISDLARIYQQGASIGSFGQDKINQLAERGIDIYHALEAATGKSGGALKEMISEGQIGIKEMDAALAHMTEGNGIYAGSLDVMANTTAGKFSAMKNNMTQALGEIMGVALEIFQPFFTAIVAMSEQLKAGFMEFREPVMFAATAVAWLFKNFVDLSRFAFVSFGLFSVTAFNDFAYFFTDTVPAYLAWFSQNWKQVFVDAGNLIVTVFSNIAKNIGSAMRAIWDYIKSGGTTDLQFAFTPLLDGFEATVSELPNIPDRAMTELEKQLSAEIEGLGSSLANDFDAMLANTVANANIPQAELSGQTSGGVNASPGDAMDKASKDASRRAVENKGSLIRSSEGQSVLAQLSKAMGKGDDTKRTVKAVETVADKITNIEREVRNGRRLIGSKFA